MGNIIDYLGKEGTLPFSEYGFNTIDALVLSELAYLKFDGLVGGMEAAPVTLQDIMASENFENLFSEPGHEKNNRELFNAVSNSARFSDIKFSCYINMIGEEFQFSAITFFLPEGIIFVAFRGTDETMVGWQEDFFMALKRPVQGQLLSAKYINELSGKINGSFMVGGHSKGGNLAMYAAMCSCDEAKARIEKIYSFDGPGFRPEVMSENQFSSISDKVIKIIPKSSPIGMIFNNCENAMIIESKAMGALQHNPFNWVIKDGEFVETHLTEQHKITTKAMNEWLLSLDDENLKTFVDILCWILDSTNATTTTQVKEDFGKHMKALFKAGSDTDEETRARATELVKSFMSLVGDLFMQEAKEKYDNFRDELVRRYEELIRKAEEMTQGVMKQMEKTKDEIMKPKSPKDEG